MLICAASCASTVHVCSCWGCMLSLVTVRTCGQGTTASHLLGWDKRNSPSPQNPWILQHLALPLWEENAPASWYLMSGPSLSQGFMNKKFRNFQVSFKEHAVHLTKHESSLLAKHYLEILFIETAGPSAGEGITNILSKAPYFWVRAENT